MERRSRVRLAELLDDAHVPPTLLRGVLPRLQIFLQPFLDALPPQQQTNAHHDVQGVLSDLGSKDVESIAYLHDRERQGLQKFIAQADWDHQLLLPFVGRTDAHKTWREREPLFLDYMQVSTSNVPALCKSLLTNHGSGFRIQVVQSVCANPESVIR